jgi:hypothetical protein
MSKHIKTPAGSPESSENEEFEKRSPLGGRSSLTVQTVDMPSRAKRYRRISCNSINEASASVEGRRGSTSRSYLWDEYTSYLNPDLLKRLSLDDEDFSPYDQISDESDIRGWLLPDTAVSPNEPDAEFTIVGGRSDSAHAVASSSTSERCHELEELDYPEDDDHNRAPLQREPPPREKGWYTIDSNLRHARRLSDSLPESIQPGFIVPIDIMSSGVSCKKRAYFDGRAFFRPGFTRQDHTITIDGVPYKMDSRERNDRLSRPVH